jgi:hypothetical protein
VSAVGLNWRPMTSLPDTADYLSVLIAFKEFSVSAPVLADQLYTWNPINRLFIGDDDGEPFAGFGWWLPEQDVLFPILDAEGPCRTCIPW